MLQPAFVLESFEVCEIEKRAKEEKSFEEQSGSK